jgi:hypothetical protein
MSRNKLIVGVNDLKTANPELSKQANGWDPTTVTAMSNKEREWICEDGHAWSATVKHRSLGSGCLVHTGRQVLVGFNDLATIHPEIATQAYGWDPTTVTAGAHQIREWICEDGHVWSARVDNRSQGKGCPNPACVSHGFVGSQPGWLYLMEHVEYDYFQIGISNSIEKRLGFHRRRGWTDIEVIGPWETGTNARQWESALIKGLKEAGAKTLKDIGVEISGITPTEAWTRASLPVVSLRELMAIVPDNAKAKLVEPATAVGK